MNAREWLVKTLLFDRPDKAPLAPGRGRDYVARRLENAFRLVRLNYVHLSEAMAYG